FLSLTRAYRKTTRVLMRIVCSTSCPIAGTHDKPTRRIVRHRRKGAKPQNNGCGGLDPLLRERCSRVVPVALRPCVDVCIELSCRESMCFTLFLINDRCFLSYCLCTFFRILHQQGQVLWRHGCLNYGSLVWFDRHDQHPEFVAVLPDE